MAAASNDSSPGPWLVKSGDRILGPYSTDELARLIREKEVVVIDEIMAPQARWAYLRDVAVFKTIVEEIRSGLMQAREDTEVAGYTSPVKASVPEMTKTGATGTAVTLGEAGSPSDRRVESKNENEDKTLVTSTGAVGDVANSKSKTVAPTPLKPVGPTSSSKPIDSAPGKNTDKSADKWTDKPKFTMDPLPHHSREGLAEKAAAEAQAPAMKKYERPRVGSRAGVVLGSIVLITVVTLIIWTVLKSPQTTTVANADTLATQASVAWKRGEFERALELYRALNSHQPGRPIVAARLALLMMKLEGQTVEAKRVIESAQAFAKTDDEKSELAIASGLALLQAEDAKEAAAKFSKAGHSWIAAFDEGVAQSLLKNWDEAVKSFRKAGDNAVSMLMLARTHLNAGEASAIPKPVARKEADDAIRRALVGAPDFQQESLLVAAYIDAMSGNEKRAAKEVVDSLETDPNQTGDHFHEPGLNLDQVSWSRLLPYCEALRIQLASHTANAMLAMCLAKSNRVEEATKLVDGEIAKEPSNPYLHAVDAYLNTLADRDDAARASLTLSAKNGNSRLAQILSARLCAREKQDACAEEAWSKLAMEANAPIASITGLAQLRAAKGDTASASALLVKAEKLSPTYMPLLRIREDASR